MEKCNNWDIIFSRKDNMKRHQQEVCEQRSDTNIRKLENKYILK